MSQASFARMILHLRGSGNMAANMTAVMTIKINLNGKIASLSVTSPPSREQQVGASPRPNEDAISTFMHEILRAFESMSGRLHRASDGAMDGPISIALTATCGTMTSTANMTFMSDFNVVGKASPPSNHAPGVPGVLGVVQPAKPLNDEADCQFNVEETSPSSDDTRDDQRAQAQDHAIGTEDQETATAASVAGSAADDFSSGAESAEHSDDAMTSPSHHHRSEEASATDLDGEVLPADVSEAYIPNPHPVALAVQPGHDQSFSGNQVVQQGHDQLDHEVVPPGHDPAPIDNAHEAFEVLSNSDSSTSPAHASASGPYNVGSGSRRLRPNNIVFGPIPRGVKFFQ